MLKVVVLQFPDQTPVLGEIAMLAKQWDSSNSLCCYSYCYTCSYYFSYIMNLFNYYAIAVCI